MSIFTRKSAISTGIADFGHNRQFERILLQRRHTLKGRVPPLPAYIQKPHLRPATLRLATTDDDDLVPRPSPRYRTPPRPHRLGPFRRICGAFVDATSSGGGRAGARRRRSRASRAAGRPPGACRGGSAGPAAAEEEAAGEGGRGHVASAHAVARRGERGRRRAGPGGVRGGDVAAETRPSGKGGGGGGASPLRADAADEQMRRAPWQTSGHRRARSGCDSARTGACRIALETHVTVCPCLAGPSKAPRCAAAIVSLLDLRSDGWRFECGPRASAPIRRERMAVSACTEFERKLQTSGVARGCPRWPSLGPHVSCGQRSVHGPPSQTQRDDPGKKGLRCRPLTTWVSSIFFTVY